MSLEIIRQDITRMHVDAIVNAANPALLGGGGVDGAIHRAAGPGLLEECRTLGGCKTGEAKITRGYDLPCRYVIHTVGPIWHGGHAGEREKLAACYKSALRLARAHGCGSVAFPLISAGVYGYPRDKALRVATDTIRDFLMESDADMHVYLAIFDKASFAIGEKLYAGIAQYIDDNYAGQHTARSRSLLPEEMCELAKAQRDIEDVCEEMAMPQEALREVPPFAPMAAKPEPKKRGLLERLTRGAKKPAASIEDALAELEDGFTPYLLRKIDERGMTDVQCYKKANIDRKLFSKIRSSANYKPSKNTALALAIALELSLEETRDILSRAGLALSHASKFDIIIEYFIANGQYDIFEINEALFAFDQPLLGA